LDRAGLLNKIFIAVYYIVHGRKGLSTDGTEHEGRITFEKGLSEAMQAFREVQSVQDLEIMLLAEYTFLGQELEFCSSTETNAISSLTQAMRSIDDALRVLEIIENSDAYKSAEKAFPRKDKYRIHTMPKDAFNIACIAHRTRITNTLRTPGINKTELALFEQRLANMSTAQQVYWEKQKKALVEV
jgi:hypothetical protein